VLETVRIALIVTEFSGSIDNDGFVIVHFLAENFAHQGFGEDRKENFFLHAAITKNSTAQMFVCKVNHDAFAAVVLDRLVLDPVNLDCPQWHFSLHLHEVQEVSVGVFGALETDASLEEVFVLYHEFEICDEAL
jgi:hypothetical protein